MAVLRNLKFSLQKKFLLSIVLIIVPVLGLIFAWAGIHNKHNTIEQVINQARVLSRQIILTRQWIADCGGVMVARNSEGAKSYRYFFDDQLQTSRGAFNRFTPSMVTKKLSQYSLRENLYHFRLASLNPMNPDNSPDIFEKMALMRFIHQKSKEVYSFDNTDNKQVFRYTVPLYVDKACMECHKNFSAGTIGGCLSIFLPSHQVEGALQTTQIRLIYSGVTLILLTILTLFFLLRHVVIKPVNQLRFMADDIKNGDLNARVTLKTNDEFERLGESFNGMGQQLAHNREIMEEKIGKATQELSDANCELQKLDKLKTEFIADMSHELRSPVTAIKGGLDYLKRTTTDKENKSYLSLIDNNLLRLTHMVNEMLDLTRIEAGKVAWNFETYDMTALILEIIEIITLKAEAKNLTLTFNRSDPLWVKMDIERIEQVLVNVVENAIKFSPENSSIQINSQVDDQWCHVTITDSGIGIGEEDLENIFKKFHTLPSGSKNTHTKGTGLGLTICRKIIKAHGGKIWAESEVGKGSTFAFTIPQKQGL
jgi:signal transduction histidine kinase